jgi:hypothetical protein
MIDLMLHRARPQPLAGEGHFLAALVDAGDRYPFRARDLAIQSRQAKAPLRTGLAAFAGDDLRIDQDMHLLLYLDGDQAQRYPDLGRGQADTVVLAHGFDHFGSEILNFRRYTLNARGLFAQDRIRIFNDHQFFHLHKILADCPAVNSVISTMIFPQRRGG